jgi:hypothetical protein
MRNAGSLNTVLTLTEELFEFVGTNPNYWEREQIEQNIG